MKETIETKKAASVNEAIEIINRLNYRNDTFEYHGYTREDNADIKYRHFDGYKENGELDGFSLIEIVVNGKLEVIRFFNHFRNITVDIKLGDFNLDYSRYDEVIDADAKIESNAEVESNGNDAEAKTKMKTIEMKIAKNGNIIVKTDDGIETSRKFADAVAALADTTFIGKPDVEIIVDRNDDSHICDIYKGGFDFNQSSYIFTDNNGNEYSFWDSHLALKQFARGIFGEAITVKPAVNEANPDDYAVTEDALEVAVNAEIQAANNAKINDLKWEIRYTEGSINDLDKNHIAHFPNDQSLQERRAELTAELAALKAQLAELLPAEVNTNSEYKYYIQSRRPIAGAVPNGYISATQGEMKAYSLRTDGSISPVPRKVVFGEVVYDHPLSDEQIINYDLHVDPRNPKAEPDTTELSDEEIAEIKRRSQINAIKSRIATYERAIERQYDQELENSLNAAKAQLAEIEPANTHEADHTTGIKEEQPMTIEIPAEGTHEFTIGDDTVCFFNGKFHSVFSAKYHMAIVRDLVGCFSYCIYNDGDTEVFNVREHAVSYDNFMETLHQRGNREKLLALRKEYIITDRLSKNNSSMWYVNGKRSSQVKVWNLLQSYGLTLAEFLTENEAYINGCIVASCKQIAIKDQSDFYADKINRESKSIDDYTTDRDAVFNLLPDLDNDAKKVWLTRGELDDLTAKFRDAVSIIPVTTRIEKMLPVTIKITKQNRSKTFDMGFGAFAKYSIVQWITGLRIMRNFSTLGVYETPSQIEEVIRRLETAIVRGDKAFTFPTVEELDPNPDDELIDPPELPTAKPRTLRDSLKQGARRELEVA